MKTPLASFLLTATLAVLPTEPAAAQAPETPAATFGEAVRVEVVNIEVVVTDRRGEPVTGLTAEDFEVFENGEPRPIVNFYAEDGGLPRPAAAPTPSAPRASAAEALRPASVAAERQLHLLVFIDNSHLQTGHRRAVFGDLRNFLHSSLEDSALLSIVTLGQTLRVHSDFLSDRAAIDRILDRVEKQSSFNAAESIERRQLLGRIFESETQGARGFDPVIRGDLEVRVRAYAQSELERGRVTLDALSRFVATLAGIPGRKAMLYVADGIPRRPGQELFEALAGGANTTNFGLEREILNYDLLGNFQQLAREANAAQVTLFTLDPGGDHRSELRSAALSSRVPSDVFSTVEANYREPQEFASGATGGRRIAAGAGLEEGLDSVARELTSFYSLGISPAEGERSRPRNLRVEVKRPGLLVRHRDSYQPKAAEQRAAEATLATLLYGTGSNPLGISLTKGPAQARDDGTSIVALTVKIPLDAVALLPSGEVHAGRLSIFVTTQGAKGETRPVQKIPFHAAIPADKVAELAGEELSYNLPVVVRSGDRRIAVGVRDEIGGVSATVRVDLSGK